MHLGTLKATSMLLLSKAYSETAKEAFCKNLRCPKTVLSLCIVSGCCIYTTISI